MCGPQCPQESGSENEQVSDKSRRPVGGSTGLVAVAVVTLLLMLAGCGNNPQADSSEQQQTTSQPGMPESPITDRLVECMTDAGWNVQRSWQGGVEAPNVPAGQQSAYESASQECAKSTGWADAVNNLDNQQVRYLYEQEVATHDCFLKIGIDSSEPPSEQRYLDTFRTKDQYYAFLPGFDSLNEDAMQKAVRQCPPPTWFLNVSGL